MESSELMFPALFAPDLKEKVTGNKYFSSHYFVIIYLCLATSVNLFNTF